MKNVTGYDLVKLMAGSYGTLGVLSEVSFKVLPRPEMTGVVLLHGLDDETASIAMAKALSSPFDISGAAHLSLGSNDIPLTMIRVEGFTGSIKYRTWKLKELLAGILPAKAEISIELDQTKAQDLWKLVRDVEPFHGSSSDVWRLSVKPGDGWKIVETLHKNMETKTLYDWGGGLVWLAAETNGDNAKSNAEAIRSAVNAVGGHATLIRSNAPHSEVDAFHPEHPRVAQISQQLRQQFDPKSILNPGRMAHVQQSRSMVGA